MFWTMTVVMHLSSHVQLFATTWTAAYQASLSLTISWSLPKFMFIASVMPSIHLIPWHPLVLLPLIFPRVRDFSNESSVCIRWSKLWSFSFSISPSSEYSVLISLKINWFDLFAVQGTFRSLFQHHSLKASILWHSEQWYPYPKFLSNPLPSKSLNPLPSKMVTVGFSLISHSNLLAENWKI